MQHYSRHNFISNIQHGFQKGLGCDTQLATPVEELQRGLDNKYQHDVVILDFNKAFGKVPHRHLKKLDASGNIHKWLTTYLTNRTQRVRPCPHDTFPNRVRSIASSSRSVARVHTGATGTLVPISRDHLATWNERARSIAIGCALSTLSCGRSTGLERPVR